MRKSKKKKLKKNLIIIGVVFVNILAMQGTGTVGEFIQDIFKFIFGITHFWINLWVIFFSLLFLLKKKKRKKIMKYIYAVLLVGISFDLLVNYALNYNRISTGIVDAQWKINSENINDGLGIVQSDVLNLTHNAFGLFGTGVIIILAFLTGIFLILDLDDTIHSAYRKMQKIFSRKNKKKSKKSKVEAKKAVIEEDNIDDTFEKQSKKKILSFKKNSDKQEKIKVTPDFEKKEIKSNLDLVKKKPELKFENNSLESKKIIDEDKTIGDPIVLGNIYQMKYYLPSMNLLQTFNADTQKYELLEQEAVVTGEKLINALETYKLKAKIKNTIVGPAITKFELEPELGVKVNKIANLSNDLAMAMAARSIRIEAPIPGKSLIGIEVPNSQNLMVGLKNILEDEKNKFDEKALIGLGESIGGKATFLDITKTPHLLVAGSTGSGKSVCINSIIVSILMKATPNDVKLLLIDPKKVELTPYNGIPHLLSPVITDPEEAAIALNKLILEMDKRYELFANTRTKNIQAYNQKMLSEDREEEVLPLIITIIDELADLMMVASNEVETAIARLAQMARASGIHLIIATQRPSTDVITGLIKSNIPTRIAFLVSSSIDSRTILDSKGAEKLLGYGDMLLSRSGSQGFERIQGAYVDDKEINDIVNTISEQFPNQEENNFFAEEFVNLEAVDAENGEKLDDLAYAALEIGITYNKISTSLIQRKLKIGYNRAATIIEQLEERKYVSRQEGNKARVSLIKTVEELKKLQENGEL